MLSNFDDKPSVFAFNVRALLKLFSERANSDARSINRSFYKKALGNVRPKITRSAVKRRPLGELEGLSKTMKRL